MRTTFKLLFIGLLCIFLIGCTEKEINSSEVLDLVQSNYLSIEFNDKKISENSKEQYLIDYFIPKLGRYTLKSYSNEIPTDYSNKVTITYKDGSKIVLIDNNYLTIDEEKYEIVDGIIDLEKFYQFIDSY